jgi:uncharacterized membrane protein
MDAGERSVSRRAGIVLGIGLGGFVDGIVLHQIVHWHNMGSAVVPPVTIEALRLNMRWDGLFHAAVWLCTVAGVYLLLDDARRGVPMPRTGPFTGLLLLGWGLFNLVEGVVDHHLLDLHHVRDLPAHVAFYDWVFLLLGGLGFSVLGWAMSRRNGPAPGWAAAGAVRSTPRQ